MISLFLNLILGSRVCGACLHHLLSHRLNAALAIRAILARGSNWITQCLLLLVLWDRLSLLVCCSKDIILITSWGSEEVLVQHGVHELRVRVKERMLMRHWMISSLHGMVRLCTLGLVWHLLEAIDKRLRGLKVRDRIVLRIQNRVYNGGLRGKHVLIQVQVKLVVDDWSELVGCDVRHHSWHLVRVVTPKGLTHGIHALHRGSLWVLKSTLCHWHETWSISWLIIAIVHLRELRQVFWRLMKLLLLLSCRYICDRRSEGRLMAELCNGLGLLVLINSWIRATKS